MDSVKSPPSPKKLNVLSFLKYEHLVAGISGGVTSTLILHPLDLIKIRFAGELDHYQRADELISFSVVGGGASSVGGLTHLLISRLHTPSGQSL